MPHLIIFAALVFCGLVASCVLTSCQPLVQPFRPEEKTPVSALFRVRDAGGIVVRPVAGMPEGTDGVLVESLISELQRLEIPASTGSSGNRRSLFLDGQVHTAPIDRERLAVEIVWRLSDVNGRTIGEPRTTGEVWRDLWGKPGTQPYAALAERSVAGIAALVQDPVARAPSEPETRRYYVWPVAGAPGNGGAALSQAMGAALRAAKLPVADVMAEDALIIAGSVRVSPPDKGGQKVEIVWTVLESGGRELAKLAQANIVKEGVLDGEWGDLARIIADAAVPTMADLLRQMPPRAEAPSSPTGG